MISGLLALADVAQLGFGGRSKGQVEGAFQGQSRL